MNTFKLIAQCTHQSNCDSLGDDPAIYLLSAKCRSQQNGHHPKNQPEEAEREKQQNSDLYPLVAFAFNVLLLHKYYVEDGEEATNLHSDETSDDGTHSLAGDWFLNHFCTDHLHVSNVYNERDIEAEAGNQDHFCEREPLLRPPLGFSAEPEGQYDEE